MAVAMNYSTHLELDKIQQMRENLLLCSVCMEEFDDPRILTCHHTFCLHCIESIVQRLTTNQRILSCPQCRKNISIPRKGVNNFPVNFYLVSLRDELGAAEHAGMCAICGSAMKQLHCMDCDLSICRFCIAAHRLNTHSGRSRIVRIASPPELSPLSTTAKTCKTHPGQLLESFCRTCQKGICAFCSDGKSHRRHNVVVMSECLEEIKNFVLKESIGVTKELYNVNESASLVEACKKEIIRSSDESILNLNRAVERSCGTIMKLKAEMEKEMQAAKAVQLTRINDVEKKLRAYKDLLHKGHDFLKELQEVDVCFETLESYETFSTDTKEIRKRLTSTSFQLKQLSFASSYGLASTNIKLRTRKTQFLYGNLGFLKSKEQNVYINKKTLQLMSPSCKMPEFLTSSKFLKIGLFIASFFFFNYVLDLASNSRHEFLFPATRRQRLSTAKEGNGREFTGIIASALDYFFAPY